MNTASKTAFQKTAESTAIMGKIIETISWKFLC